MVGCYFPRDPRSISLSAKAHGRVAIIVKALELMLSVVYGLNHTFGLRSRLVSPLPVSVCTLAVLLCRSSRDDMVTALCSNQSLEQAACGVFSLASLYTNTTFLPFYKPAMNIAHILHSCVFTLASLMFLYAEIRRHPEVSLSVPVCPAVGKRLPLAKTIIHFEHTSDSGSPLPYMHHDAVRVIWVSIANRAVPPLQDNVEAFMFFLGAPMVCCLGYLTYMRRFDHLRLPQVVNSPFLVR